MSKKSDEFINWAASLSAFLTKINKEYENAGELIEDSEWDDGKTNLAVSILKSLKKSVNKIEKEMRSHVENRY